MKLIHWIIFAIAFWIILVPFIGDDLVNLILQDAGLQSVNLVALFRWDDLFLGLTIAILSLVVVTLEQPSLKTAALRVLHWLQFGLGAWIAAAPFALDFTMANFTWSHFVTGFFIGIFALVQINLEDTSH